MTTPVSLFGDSRLMHELLPPPDRTSEQQPTLREPATLPHIKITIGDEAAILPYVEKKPDPFSDEYGVPPDKMSFPIRLNEERTIYLIRNVNLNETAQKIVGYVLLLQELANRSFSREEHPVDFEFSEQIRTCIFEANPELTFQVRRSEGRYTRLPPPIDFLPFKEQNHRIHSLALNRLPLHLGQLRGLTHLNLNNHSFLEFPTSICELTRLVHLSVRGGFFSDLPPEFRDLTQLTFLDLAECKNIRNLGAQYVEYLEDQKIISYSLDPVISGFTQLQYLSLAATGLTSLPEQFRGLSGLIGLNISHLKLSKMPDWIGELRNLKELYAKGNYLKTLPSSMARLELDELDVTQNLFCQFPDNFKVKASSTYHLLCSQGYEHLLQKTDNPQGKKSKKLQAEIEAQRGRVNQFLKELQTQHDTASPAPSEQKPRASRVTGPFRGGPSDPSVKKK